MRLLIYVLPIIFFIHLAYASDYNHSLENGDLNVCERTFKDYEQALGEISSEANLHSENEHFIIYMDDKTKTIWNFTTQTNPAHPSIGCQRLVSIQGKSVMGTEVNCTVEKETCDYLVKYFAEKSSLLMKKAHERE